MRVREAVEAGEAKSRMLGELARFPEPSLVAQFGEDGRSALAWSTGRRIDPVRPWHRPRPIRVSLEFSLP
ncbi:MAG TPA: hypothetical protein VM198_07395 [Longimicrobiales bacterium]|nr:hypothetical protein [Longimicrobiales bacterium]